ncbi:hypothetical protein LZ554_006987 [Drepanopeziza brunnea f. sp. 'monogermtubi']|nr:hypothetical protein LZ554_006987 [Drepanopeziza brunnea f. sp. 'monogermtubi']
MMFINAILATAALAASAVTAVPADLAARQAGKTIKLCRDANLVNCREWPYQPDTCVDVWPNAEFDDQVSSLDTYGINCKFVMDVGCSESSGSFDWAGSFPDIKGSKFDSSNNAISSFTCKGITGDPA